VPATGERWVARANARAAAHLVANQRSGSVSRARIIFVHEHDSLLCEPSRPRTTRHRHATAVGATRVGRRTRSFDVFRGAMRDRDRPIIQTLRGAHRTTVAAGGAAVLARRVSTQPCRATVVDYDELFFSGAEGGCYCSVVAREFGMRGHSESGRRQRRGEWGWNGRFVCVRGRSRRK
jgi:hypothetical protein